MAKIESLTQAQVDSMNTIRDQWIAIGLDTAPIDSAAAIQAAAESYRLVNMAAPRFYLFPRGPVEAMKFLSFAAMCNLTEDDFIELSDAGPLALTDAIRSNMQQYEESVEKIGYDFVPPAFYGQHDAAWLAFHAFFGEHFGLSELSLGLQKLAKQAGWVWLYKDIALIAQKPMHITMNNGKLHNEKGAAIEYADGTKIYSFNGVVIPEKWVLERSTINPSEILECKDTDKRAAGIALYGYDKLKNLLDYKIIDGNPNTDIGALIEIKIPGLSRPGRFLEAVCPRNGPVFLGVPMTNPWDKNADIVSAVGAQAFLARLPESAYQHPPIRT
jgi:hypothetical protein